MAGETNETVVQNGQQVKWGTDDNLTYGMIQSINVGVGGSTKEYKDSNGNTKTLVVYDKHNTINLTAIMLADSKLPELGDAVTINVGGEEYDIYVQSASVDWANEEAAKITISGRTYPTLGNVGGSSSGDSSSGGGFGE